ncbi:putative Tigger transposable element-derived protein 2 [Danaus plexippus plexippus]|uniref:Tigger transposable element-derived protein 2 n=1 Tax=Danaus plexippus plexippus TaxID=278856 RepID=A0A212FGJ6_DANPL|nr:putative Tigger transposable element-derived protein 2 [Danaus plexippus plexippus]
MEFNTDTYGKCRFCNTTGHHRDITKVYNIGGVREVYFDIILDCFNLCLRDANSFRTLVMNAEIHLHDGLGNENTVFINTGKNPLDTEVKLENVKEDNENVEINDHNNEAKAQKIFTHLKELETVSSDEPKSKFVSSNGCFERFRKRFSLHSIQIQGERASADYESARNFKEELPKIIDEGEYTADQVYNADETGLYWKRMPKRTYLSENERSAGGLKASKERITLLVCSNASGDHITKPMLINRFLSPRAMKGIDKTTLPVHWRANENAWVTADIFHDWFYNCFVPEVENYSKTKNVSSKALLLIDDAPQHPVDLVHPNVKVLFLPANTTSILQPLDQGVMKTIKSHYIRRTLELISEKFECKPDMKLAEMWKDFSILKCVELICLSVRELKSSTLNACWKNVWPEVVLQENLLDSTSINIEPIVNIARSVGGEGFDDMNERDIYELINDAADLDEEELVQLADTSDANMTNSAEESSMQTVDEGDEQ